MAVVAIATININAEPLNIPRRTGKVGSLLSKTNLEAATFEEYPMLNRKKRFYKFTDVFIESRSMNEQIGDPFSHC